MRPGNEEEVATSPSLPQAKPKMRMRIKVRDRLYWKQVWCQLMNFRNFQLFFKLFLIQKKIKNCQTCQQSKQAEMLNNRKQAVDELLQTEKNYIISLAKVKMFFMIPLQELYLKKQYKDFTEEDFDNLFGNLTDVVLIGTKFHKELLHEVERAKNSAQALIGKVVAEKAEEFLSYAKYMGSFDTALEVLGRIQKKKEIAAVLKDAVVKSAGGLDLGSYLIMPVQRLPRYEVNYTHIYIYIYIYR